MKISSIQENLRLIATRDGDNSSGSFQEERGRKRKPHPYAPEKKESGPVFEVTDEAISAAILAFRSDNQAQTQGIEAEKQGEGPGLRVILKDGTGAIIRQLTGEEFLRLREAASQDGRVSGKILDQKA
jgi:hypothetical protein